MTKSAAPAVAARLEEFLRAHSILEPNEIPTCTPLLGGVSSDIWRVITSRATLCVKRALPELKVASDWKAPVNRNANEWAWLCFAFKHQPRAVPTPLAHDPEAGFFAMSYLPPEDYPVWKQRLLHGQIDVSTAIQVATVVAALHNASAGDSDLAGQFDSLEIFSALRLDPYFAATATQHPTLAARLQAISDRTACTRRALVHGDISPKNILVGASGPVILDAECACYGDPAFDLAFCLTQLLLKSLVHAHHLGA